MQVGIESLGVAVPELVMDMATLARARGVEPGKYLEGLGVHQMAVPGLDEDTVTLAVRAAAMALESGGVQVDDIGLCIVGTETAVDHSKPVASWVQGLLGLPGNCRVYETKHACYGATAGLMAALDWHWAGSSRGRKALIIASDIARYGLGTPGEPTQGGGAVALVVSVTPRLLAFEKGAVGTSSSDVMDFWRPLHSKDALVDGHYSVQCYLDALRGAFASYRENLGLTGKATEDFAALCYHVPYPKMAKKAHEALCAADQRYDAAESFGPLVAPGLELPRRVGNLYTGSLYLSVASALNSAASLEGQRMGLFSYGSGNCADFFTARVLPGAQAQVQALGLPALLDARKSLTLEAYEDVMRQRETLDERPAAIVEVPYRFAGVQGGKRLYSRPGDQQRQAG